MLFRSQPTGTNSLISVRAGLAGQSKYMTKPPEAATGRRSALQESSPRSQERRGQSAPSASCTRQVKDPTNLLPLPKLRCAKRHARSLALAADAGYRDCSCRGAQREAESHACKSTLASLPRELMPNPSLKRSANGRPPGPVSGAEHFPQPGPGVLPPSPA